MIPRPGKIRIDYKVYNSTGEKVIKNVEQFEMEELKKLKIEEQVIVEDIKHTLSLYKLEDLGTESEVQEAVGMVSELSSKYRHLHVEIKNLDEENYPAAFPNYKTILDKLNEYIKTSRVRLREILADPKEGIGVGKESDVASFRVRFDVLASQIAFMNDSVDILTATGNVEIEKYVSRSESFLEKLFQLSAEMAQKCPVWHEREFEKEILKIVLDIRDDIKMAKILRKELQKHCETEAKQGTLEKH